MLHAGKTRWGGRVFCALRVLLAGLVALPVFAGQKQDFRPFVIPLKPYGIPKKMFSSGGPGCRHVYAAGTRLFWLGSDRIFVAFTTGAPCTFRAREEPAEVRGIVFDTKGNARATHVWPIHDGGSEGDGNDRSLNIFPGPKNTVLFRRGARLDVYGPTLETIETGELDQNPRALWVTPHRRTIPLLSADGRLFEFYQPDPLSQVGTIALDQSTEANTVKDWVPGDERVAGTYCGGVSLYSCSKIIVLTTDARFLSPDGEPWTFEEKDHPVSLKPIGFLDPRHLVVVRKERGFFHSPKLMIVRPIGSAMTIPSPGSAFMANRIVGVTPDANRFAVEFLAPGNCDDCIDERYFSVIDLDGGKLVFEASGSPYFSDGDLSPDGKAFAVLDSGSITIYPLP